MAAHHSGNCILCTVHCRKRLRDISIFFRGDAYGYVNAFLMNLGIIDSPILWLTNPDYMLPVCMIVILWMSLGTGFLSFVAGLQGVDRSQFEAGYMDGVKTAGRNCGTLPYQI